MADIFHHFPINEPIQKVFDGVATPAGLDAWWTLRSSGKPVIGQEYELYFGEAYDWRAVVTKCVWNDEFELQMTGADKDWQGTRVGFRLENKSDITQVRFYHIGWPEANEHFRTSSYCWAMYLRLLKRHIEFGEFVKYEVRLDV